MSPDEEVLSTLAGKTIASATIGTGVGSPQYDEIVLRTTDGDEFSFTSGDTGQHCSWISVVRSRPDEGGDAA